MGDEGEDLAHRAAREDSLSDLVHCIHSIDRPAALTTVTNEGCGVTPTANFDGRKTHLNREFGAVAVTPSEIKALTHLARPRSREELLQMTSVVRSAVGGNQYVDRRTDELFWVITE